VVERRHAQFWWKEGERIELEGENRSTHHPGREGEPVSGLCESSLGRGQVCRTLRKHVG